MINTKSGVKVWIYPPTGELALSWHVYGCIEMDNAKESVIVGYDLSHIELSAYQYVGEAVENKNGITCIFHENYLKNFEFVGIL